MDERVAILKDFYLGSLQFYKNLGAYPRREYRDRITSPPMIEQADALMAEILFHPELHADVEKVIGMDVREYLSLCNTILNNARSDPPVLTTPAQVAVLKTIAFASKKELDKPLYG